MKKILSLLLACFCGVVCFGAHITGGEMFYVLTGQNGNNYTYQITLKLYRDCQSSGAPLDPSAPISIYDNNTFGSVWAGNVTMTSNQTLNLGSPSPCIQSPPTVCYQVGFYVFTVTLPASSRGYTVVYQRCCRIAGINNLINSGSVGSTYTAVIPGNQTIVNAPANNSARFVGADTVIVCANNAFCYDFSAVDPDAATLGDSLAYNFCNAYVGGSQQTPAPNPPQAPPYAGVPYNINAGFDESAPMGPRVTLDPRTGQMCGVAPAVGIYTVTVCVTEFRNGQPIATQRKDLQIKVGDCNIADAFLKPEYITCDGFTYTFTNEAPPSALVTSWYWDFGDGNTSTLPTPSHTYADTGTYRFKLVVNRGQECSDSATALIKVYPGFFPGFTVSGVCVNRPTQFTDTTNTRYGVVNSWNWDFGDVNTTTDVSTAQNPTYTYPRSGPVNVRFIVTNSKGCIDTVMKTVNVVDKPPLSARFKDTLICNGDTLQLEAVGNGTFSWTPNTNIINPSTATPLVFPSVTTNYFVRLDDNGCINNDTVRVRVINSVTLQTMPDTTICFPDSVRLRASGDGLRYVWTPAATLSNPNVPNPNALPANGTNVYRVDAFVGRCVTTANVVVNAVPYPNANAGADEEICFRTSAQLNGNMVGTRFTWSPTSSLNNPNILNPVASPFSTTSYVLTVFDDRGCPKPGRDTVVVKVFPKVNAFAGRDTAVIAGQPLQFNASGGTGYLWTPNTGLTRSDIANPIGRYLGDFDSIRYKVVVTDANNCVDSAYVSVRIFTTEPQVFVPSAFTPNGDGKNDVFRPIPVGITQIEYFRVFNRWGELVWSSTSDELGWDGRIKGKQQNTAVYVWIVKAVDYTGKGVFYKGTVTLIR